MAKPLHIRVNLDESSPIVGLSVWVTGQTSVARHTCHVDARGGCWDHELFSAVTTESNLGV